MNDGTARRQARHYGLDWLRVGAFLLVVVHHVGMYFTPEPWMVKSAQPVDWLIWPMLALQPWRMALLFAVSGYASRILLLSSGSVGAFSATRSFRLLLPLLFGMLVLIPPQTWVWLSAHHLYGEGLLHFWTHDWIAGAGPNGLLETGHLWFLAYLWTYTILLAAALWAAPSAVRDRVAALAPWLCTGTRLLWAPLLPLLAARLLLLFTIPEAHGLLHDWVSDLTYLPAFLFGFALAALPGAWKAVLRTRGPALAAAGGSLLLLILLQYLYPGDRGHIAQALDREASLVMAWSMILLLFASAHRWLNRDHRWRRPLCEAIFPCFLIHHPLIILVGWQLAGAGLSNLQMFAVLLSSALGGSFLFYRIGRELGMLRPLFGLAPRLARRAAARTAFA